MGKVLVGRCTESWEGWVKCWWVGVHNRMKGGCSFGG